MCQSSQYESILDNSSKTDDSSFGSNNEEINKDTVEKTTYYLFNKNDEVEYVTYANKIHGKYFCRKNCMIYATLQKKS